MKRWGPRLFVRSFVRSFVLSLRVCKPVLCCVVLCSVVFCCRLFPIHNKRTCSAVTTNFKEPLRAPPAKGAAYLLKTANFFVQDCSAAGPCHHIPSSLPSCPMCSAFCALCSVLCALCLCSFCSLTLSLTLAHALLVATPQTTSWASENTKNQQPEPQRSRVSVNEYDFMWQCQCEE